MTEIGTRRQAIDREWSQAEELFELAPVAFVVTDAHGMIRDANSAAAKLFGVEPRFLRQMKPLALFLENPREARRFMGSVLDLREPDPLEGEVVIVTRGGRRARGGVSARAFRAGGGGART